jgi:hypothetical protein
VAEAVVVGVVLLLLLLLVLLLLLGVFRTTWCCASHDGWMLSLPAGPPAHTAACLFP